MLSTTQDTNANAMPFFLDSSDTSHMVTSDHNFDIFTCLSAVLSAACCRFCSSLQAAFVALFLSFAGMNVA